MIAEAYLALGSNLGDRVANISMGLRMLSRVSAEVTASAIYETRPEGFTSQPPFLNAACRVWTGLDPFQLLAAVLEMDVNLGQRRAFVNAPRVLDIDLLLYGRLVLDSPSLVIPHPRLAERTFVLQPLAELAPGLVHPVLGETMLSLLTRLCARRDASRVSPRPLLRIRTEASSF